MPKKKKRKKIVRKVSPIGRSGRQDEASRELQRQYLAMLEEFALYCFDRRLSVKTELMRAMKSRMRRKFGFDE